MHEAEVETSLKLGVKAGKVGIIELLRTYMYLPKLGYVLCTYV